MTLNTGSETEIDLARLAEQTFGDPALQREVLTMFVAELPVLLASITATEGERRSEIAHRVKGSSAAIGALRLARAAADLEALPGDSAVLGAFEGAAAAAAQAARELLRTG